MAYRTMLACFCRGRLRGRGRVRGGFRLGLGFGLGLAIGLELGLRGGVFPHTHTCKVGLSGMRFSEGGQRPGSRASEGAII